MEKRRVNLFELFPITSFQIDRIFFSHLLSVKKVVER